MALDEDLRDNPLLRGIDQAELIFLRQSIQDVTLQHHQIQVFFFPEHYTELKYVLSKQGNYVSEVNQGKAYYSSIKDDIWLTTVEAAPGNSFSIEGRVNDKIYTIITQTA